MYITRERHYGLLTNGSNVPVLSTESGKRAKLNTNTGFEHMEIRTIHAFHVHQACMGAHQMHMPEHTTPAQNVAAKNAYFVKTKLCFAR